MSTPKSKSGIKDKTHFVGYISKRTGKIVVCSSPLSKESAEHLARALNKAYSVDEHRTFQNDTKN